MLESLLLDKGEKAHEGLLAELLDISSSLRYLNKQAPQGWKWTDGHRRKSLVCAEMPGVGSAGGSGPL